MSSPFMAESLKEAKIIDSRGRPCKISSSRTQNPSLYHRRGAMAATISLLKPTKKTASSS